MDERSLIHKPNKTREEWLTLYRAGLADYDFETDSFRINEVGAAGGYEPHEKQMAARNRQDLL